MTSKDYARKIDGLFKTNSNTEFGLKMASYMKDNFIYYGIKSADRKEIQRKLIADYGLPSTENLTQVIKVLFEYPHRENQYFAIELANKLIRKTGSSFVDTIEYMILSKSWWDSVDYIASSIAGTFFRIFPESLPSITDRWSASENMWLNRSSLIFQLKYKDSTNTQLLSRYIEAHQNSKEFFLRKAIGWSLRQYSKFNKQWVADFVRTHPMLSGLSVREASRYLD
jgi:3-methyladenine DNA glycosylase AlkD